MMKTFKIYLQMYKMNLTVSFGTEKELHEEYSKVRETKFRNGCFIPKQSIICITKKPRANRGEYINIITHEVTHFVDYQAQRKGFVSEFEHKAYLSGFLVEEIYTQLFVKKEKGN